MNHNYTEALINARPLQFSDQDWRTRGLSHGGEFKSALSRGKHLLSAGFIFFLFRID